MTPPISEDGLIATCLARVPGRPAPLGAGDDCATLPPTASTRVITTDALIEGTHFLRSHPAEALGYKALAVNLSDVAAMGARPEAFLLSAAVPPDLPPAWFEAFCDGLAACAVAAHVYIAGGDTVRSPGPLSLSITAWGLADRVLTRAGGRPGDLLCVAGPIGRSGLGLMRWLARADAPESTAASPGTTAPAPFGPLHLGPSELADPCLLHHLRPEPPLWAGPLAATLGATAAMDLSDGLATDLPRLARASHLALVVDLDALPPDPALGGLDPATRAASGEDFGLVALAPPGAASALVERGFTLIGRAEERRAPSGSDVVWRLQGRELPALVPSFSHFP